MGRRSKYNQEMKLEVVRECLEGQASSCELAERYGCSHKIVFFWVAQHQSQGEEAFRETTKNQVERLEAESKLLKAKLE